MKEIDTSAFYALLPSLDPAQISNYLDSEGWTLTERREGLLEYWQEPHTDDHRQGEEYEYLLPLSYKIRNFERRLVEFLIELADFYECNADGIRERLVTRDWDAFLVRVLSQDRSNSVGLIDATGVLEVGLKLVELSALHTVNPERSFSGPKGKVVNSYMQNDVQLGHTEPGSFVFPILSVANLSDGWNGSFGRQVMENLANGLSGVHSIAVGEAGADDPDIQKFERALLNTIQKLSKIPGCASFDVSFRWGSTGNAPLGIPRRPINFDAEMLESLHRPAPIADVGHTVSIPSTTEHRRLEPSDRVEVRGPIVALGVDDRRNRALSSSYFIVIRVIEDEALRDIRVSVNEAEFHRALEARKSRMPVVAEGTLSRDGEMRYSIIDFPSGSPSLKLPDRLDRRSN
ncbi:hypothetical protein [Streptomyces sp. NPDC058855]|uniref:hypothetical protein n=1 Tax=Streptomyces sp. NPDC058855 TaxID=3346651 RepID=UPI0036CC8E74